MFILGLPFLSLGRYLRRILFSSILASTAVVWGLAPEFSYHNMGISFSYTAYPQDISEQQVTSYARAVLKIEENRLQAYLNIQRILGKKPPEIACHRRESLRNLPPEAQKIAVSYCNNSVAIVENSGLSRSQFNDITRRLRTDSGLKKRVQDTLIRLQREQKK
jgi:hypothetical protein